MTRSEKKSMPIDAWIVGGPASFYPLLHIPLWLVKSRTYHNKINHSGQLPLRACSLFFTGFSEQSITSCNARYNLGFPN